MKAIFLFQESAHLATMNVLHVIKLMRVFVPNVEMVGLNIYTATHALEHAQMGTLAMIPLTLVMNVTLLLHSELHV